MHATAPTWNDIADRASREALEWPSYLRLLAELAASDLGAEEVLGTLPLATPAEHETRCALLLEVELLLLDGVLVPSSDEPFRGALTNLLGRRELEGRELVALARAIRALEEVRGRVHAREGLPLLSAKVDVVPPLTALVTRTSAVLDERGEIRDDASPALVRLREGVRRRRDEVYSVLAAEMSRHRDALADETFPVRDGRVVLVVQSSGRPQVDGLVHGRSASGRSVYLEPIAAVGANNALRQASDEEIAERRRLLRELLELWQHHADAVAICLQCLGELDGLQALARFSALCEARIPALAESGELRLVEARHPLLEPRLEPLREAALDQAGHRGPVVPLGLELPSELRALAITGANAGGKTVSLKTIGLAVLAARAGLPFPVGRATALPFVERLVVAIGDEQDVLQERSTFSGRLERIGRALELADPHTLVLLDELGSGTDPEEGSALGAAIVETLVAAGARVVLTTHLAPLAAHLAGLEGAATAGMDFDPESGTPRFRLRLGPVAGSQALALARRLGFPSALLRRAEGLMGAEATRLRKTLAEAEALRERLGEEHQAAALLRHELELAGERLEQERLELATTRREVSRDATRRLESFRIQVRERLGAELERMSRELEAGRRRGLAGAAVERLFAQAPELGAPEPEVSAGPLEIGAPVRHRTLGWRGRVERCDPGREVEVVVAGGMRLRASARDLVVVTPAAARAASSGSAVRRPSTPFAAAAADDTGTAPGSELMLVGRRVEEALEELDRYLDAALRSGEERLRVIHGHGTGRLRRAVREHLRGHRAVAGLEGAGPEEGGDGATIVRLRR